LENELRHNGWVVAPPNINLMQNTEGVALWRAFLARHHPILRLLADAPDEAWKN
jgi:putative AlgH/UPF0301 family transcriptional regulator